MIKAIILYLLTAGLAVPLIFNLLPQADGSSARAAPPLLTEPISVQATTLYTLYDGSLGTLPDSQGFTYLALALGASQTLTTEGTLLNTMPFTDDYAGYVNRPEQTPTLDRTSGYTVNFTVQLLAEAHDGSDRNPAVDDIDDRAGFSVTVLSSDSQGIELGFWTDQIWAQADDSIDPGNLFTHAEGVTFTTTSLTPYHLAIFSDTYMLYNAGSPILSGPLRNYSAMPNPYAGTNFIWLGDNTSSAQGQTKFTLVSVTTTSGSVSLFLPLILKKN